MVTRTLPPVTIGIPFYNAERFLLDAIRSVLAQTHRNWELILMDDGSTDRSLEIACAIKDPRVRVFSDGQNRRLAARLNEIHSLASYDLVARMDADDLMATDRIEKQLIYLQKHQNRDLVTTGVCSITDTSVPYGIRLPPDDHELTPYEVLSGAHGITHAAIVGRKEWFMRNPYDPADHWAEDYKLWIRSRQKDDLAIGFIREPLYFYRELGSMTLDKVLRAQRVGRSFIARNGPHMAGVLPTTYLLGRSIMKTIAFRMAWHTGVFDRLIRSRSSEGDELLFDSIRIDIERMKSLDF